MAFKVGFQDMVVMLGQLFDQGIAVFIVALALGIRNGYFLWLRIRIAVIMPGLIFNEIDYAFK